MLADASEAEEALQDVYMTIWRRSGTYDPARASPMTWLVAIARNRAIDRIRAAKALRRSPLAVPLDVQEHHGATSAEMLAGEAVEDSQRLAMCVEALDAHVRRAIRAAFFDGLTYEQLATREDVPLGTMKSWIRRGLISLRKCMTDARDE